MAKKSKLKNSQKPYKAFTSSIGDIMKAKAESGDIKAKKFVDVIYMSNRGDALSN